MPLTVEIQLITKIKPKGMINFASLFNQFRMSNSVADLIDAPGITLDRLLDEDSFINEFKSGNSKIQQFMKYDKYKTLVKYITEVGPAQDRKRSYKYPLSSCELLSTDSNQTLDFFFGDSPIIIRQEIVDNSQPSKQTNEGEAAAKEDKSKTDKVVIKDKLDGEEATTQAVTTDNKNQNTESQHSQGNVSSDNLEEQEKSDHQATSQQATPRIKIVEKQVEPLRNVLFSYFDGQVNYTLAGYVSKVFGAFFTKKPQAVMKFLLQPEKFKQLLNHIESRSVGELVVKLLTHESTQFIQQRKAGFQLMLEKVSKNDQVHIISNLATPICEVIQKVAASVKNANQSSIELSHIYFTPAIITQIISNVMSDQENVSVYNAPILQTYLTNVPLVIPQKSQIIQDLKQLLLSFLKKTLQKLKIKRETRPSLGFGRMKIVQIMSFVLKQNILNARQLAAQQSEFFSVILNLCKNYQYNNVLHNEVVKIIEIALNEPENSKFLQLLFQNDVLLNFLIAETDDDQKIRSGSGIQKSRKGYIGHIVSICRRIQQASTKNPIVNAFAQKKQFERIIEELVNKQVYEYNKNLAGYTMKRGTKHPVLFMKEDVIQEHIKFLTSTPPPVFQMETSEPINIEHPDLIEAQKIQTEAALQQFKQAARIKQQEESFDPRFFESHLQYNVDDLMNDL